MTLADVCDVAYVMLLQDLDRVVLIERQVAVAAAAAGAKDVSVPSLSEERARFDASLVDEPTTLPDDDDMAELRRVLGV